MRMAETEAGGCPCQLSGQSKTMTAGTRQGHNTHTMQSVNKDSFSNKGQQKLKLTMRVPCLSFLREQTATMIAEIDDVVECPSKPSLTERSARMIAEIDVVECPS